ncbi:isocitrate lyase/phosphoenolpyruvate mutase family protein, partial [Streptomyces sp. NPDC058409]|uniref:isocitrate lyase/phosphoenolpyruvate mutase family protein n=1 Tax=Streptomyces sp. NPDC058409 TaxID=3346484 RepID=UPI00364D32C3
MIGPDARALSQGPRGGRRRLRATHDGDRLTRDQALDAITRITAVVDMPVTADIERGYATDPAGVAETVRGVLAAGAVG